MNIQTSILIILLSFSLSYSQSKKEVERNLFFFEKNIDSNSDIAYYYLIKAFKLNSKLKNKKLEAECLYKRGKYFFYIEDFTKAKINLLKAENIALTERLIPILSNIYNLQGLLISYSNNKNEALKKYLKAYLIAKKFKLYENQSKILINLGQLYLTQRDTTRYLKSLNESIRLAKKNNFWELLAKSYMNSAIFYSDKKPKIAHKLYMLALTEAKKNKKEKLQLQIYINISKLNLDLNNLNEALFFIKKAHNLQVKLNDKLSLFYVYFNYGSYYLESNKNAVAIYYLKKAYYETKKNNFPLDRVLDLYKTISIANEKNGNFKMAFKFNKMYSNLSDSLITTKSNEKFHDIQIKYEVDNKNLKINLLEKEKHIIRNRKNLILFISILIVIILLTSVIFFKSRFKNQKIITEKEKIIHKQKLYTLKKAQEIKTMKAKYEGQNAERNRLAKDIHDGIGSQLAGLKFLLSSSNVQLQDTNIYYVMNQIDSILEELRIISHDLSINYIEEKEFSFLITRLINQYSNFKQFEIESYIYPKNALENLSYTIKNNLYRILQELFSNTRRHSNAKKVVLNFTLHDNFLNIIFEDDGQGLEENIIINGIGIINIKERIRLIDGDFLLESFKNKGFTISINIPIK